LKPAARAIAISDFERHGAQNHGKKKFFSTFRCDRAAPSKEAAGECYTWAIKMCFV
jgi:hypothetical protein